MTSIIEKVSQFFSKKESHPAPWEELTEKQTTKLGYFFLFCMFIASLSTAQWSMGIIQSLPNAPTPVPYCISDMLQTFKVTINTNWDFYYQGRYYWSNSNNYSPYQCSTVSAENPKFDFSSEHTVLAPIAEKINSLQRQISEYQTKISSNSSEYSKTQRDYELSLMEKMANENHSTTLPNEARDTINSLQTTEQNYMAKIDTLENEISELIQKNASTIERLRAKYTQSQADYSLAYKWYKSKVTFLNFLFAGIVTYLLFLLYSNSKRRNSPFTIIFSTATFAYWLVLLQVLLVFLWDIIPKRLMQLILTLLETFAPLLYLVQFLLPFLIVGVFGVVVYFIQKRLYSPENRLKRLIASKECPSCGNSVDITKPYCPLCSCEMQIRCPHCNELTVKWMPHCSSCGKGL
jgi:hypothetical protein